MLVFEQIAQVAHETNRIFCQTIGDYIQPAWPDVSEEQRQNSLKAVRFHVFNHFNGVPHKASSSHDKWLADKETDGWVYGLVRDNAKKIHPCMVPYSQLPLEQRVKDYLAHAVVQAFIDADEESV